jgi:hypothetical protein
MSDETRIARRFLAVAGMAAALALGACGRDAEPVESAVPAEALPALALAEGVDIERRLEDYAPFTLTADLAPLTNNQRDMLKPLIEAARIMDDLFWRQAFAGDRDAWLQRLPGDAARRYAQINYGPWDRLRDNEPFIAGAGPKPPGANFYPADMTRAELDAADVEDKSGLYSLIRRKPDGSLYSVPYHVAYEPELARAAALLREASLLAEDDGFARYLQLRATALLTDDYQPSDLAWLDSKTNRIDIVIGAIETYEDQLYGARAAYEAYVLIKDEDWSRQLARFAAFLPELQQGLPVPDAYKAETPGTDSDLNAYDVIYYAGDSNAGSKTIAINLPNDEAVQLQKGTRRLQLKNAMRAKFEKILVPIADLLVDEAQRELITFDAFFANTMFHEVAHGLGIKNTINGKGTVRNALLDAASSIEEGKADILGLYMITRLHEGGELGDADLMQNYVTFMASVFRSIRFGASSAHGRANMVRFNFFLDRGAFVRDADTGRYRIEFDAMQRAMDELAATLLTLQGDGDYDGAVGLTDELGVIRPELAGDLARLSDAGIPVDIVFKQGPDTLGL